MAANLTLYQRSCRLYIVLLIYKYINILIYFCLKIFQGPLLLSACEALYRTSKILAHSLLFLYFLIYFYYKLLFACSDKILWYSYVNILRICWNYFTSLSSPFSVHSKICIVILLCFQGSFNYECLYIILPHKFWSLFWSEYRSLIKKKNPFT